MNNLKYSKTPEIVKSKTILLEPLPRLKLAPIAHFQEQARRYKQQLSPPRDNSALGAETPTFVN